MSDENQEQEYEGEDQVEGNEEEEEEENSDEEVTEEPEEDLGSLGDDEDATDVIESYMEGAEEEDEEADPDEEYEKIGDEVEEEEEETEDEEDDEYQNALAHSLGLTMPEEGEELDTGDVSDEEIFASMRDIKTYREYFDNGRKEGKEISPEWASAVARHNMDPSYLAERDIYNMDDLIMYNQGLEARAGENAIVLPDRSDEQAWKEYEENYMGVPADDEIYADEVLEDTSYEGSQGAKDFFDSAGKEIRLNEVQLRKVVELFDNEKKDFEASKKDELIKFSVDQKKALDEVYGEDYSHHHRENNRVLKHLDPDKEFLKVLEEHPKVLASAALFNFLTNIRNAGTQPDNVKLDTFKSSVRGLPQDALLEYFDRAKKEKFLDDRFKNSKVRSEVKAHRRANKVYEALHAEMDKRNLLNY